MCEVNVLDHLIDLIVIFLADVFAAYFIIKFVEFPFDRSRKTEYAIDRVLPCVESLRRVLDDAVKLDINKDTYSNTTRILGDLTDDLVCLFNFEKDRHFLKCLKLVSLDMMFLDCLERLTKLRRGVKNENYVSELDALKTAFDQFIEHCKKA
jgi:hypothetical protein